METEKVICDHVATCLLNGHKPGCGHETPHGFMSECGKGCYTSGEAARCIPCDAPATPEPNHKRMWERLGSELCGFKAEGVRSVDPIVVRRFMAYIAQAETRQ